MQLAGLWPAALGAAIPSGGDPLGPHGPGSALARAGFGLHRHPGVPLKPRAPLTPQTSLPHSLSFVMVFTGHASGVPAAAPEATGPVLRALWAGFGSGRPGGARVLQNPDSWNFGARCSGTPGSG